MSRVENVNGAILKECREQIALSIDVVKKTFPSIQRIERGEKKPTYKQLFDLSELYKVPDWVFISEKLPQKYKFTSKSFYRKIKDQEGTNDSQVRQLIVQVESMRQMILELREDENEPIPPFNRPHIDTHPEIAAEEIRAWLGVGKKESIDFNEIKEKIEDKNIFVFTTDKYRGWSHFEAKIFRGLALFYTTLPIIIINNTDAKKAQSFTLYHELGHILQRNTVIDVTEDRKSKEEIWCNQLAANALMPNKVLRNHSKTYPQEMTLKTIDNIAKNFKVSPYVCIYRMKKLDIIGEKQTQELEKLIDQRNQENKQKKIVVPRKRPQEIFNQYGKIYLKTLWDAHSNNEIGLHKLCQLLHLKNVNYAIKTKDLL